MCFSTPSVAPSVRDLRIETNGQRHGHVMERVNVEIEISRKKTFAQNLEEKQF